MGRAHLARALLQNFTTSIVGIPTSILPTKAGIKSCGVNMRGTASWWNWWYCCWTPVTWKTLRWLINANIDAFLLCISHLTGTNYVEFVSTKAVKGSKRLVRVELVKDCLQFPMQHRWKLCGTQNLELGTLELDKRKAIGSLERPKRLWLHEKQDKKTMNKQPARQNTYLKSCILLVWDLIT